MLNPGQHIGRWAVLGVHGKGCWGLRVRVQHLDTPALHGTAEVGVLDQAQEDWRETVARFAKTPPAGVLAMLDHGEHEQLCYAVHPTQDGGWLDALPTLDVHRARMQLLELVDVIERAQRHGLDCALTALDVAWTPTGMTTAGWSHRREPGWALDALVTWAKTAGWPLERGMSTSVVRHRLFMSRPIMVEDSALALRLRIQVRVPEQGEFLLPEQVEEVDLRRPEEPPTLDDIPLPLFTMPTASFSPARHEIAAEPTQVSTTPMPTHPPSPRPHRGRTIGTVAGLIAAVVAAVAVAQVLLTWSVE
ncbi:MAG: hypothetical protein ACI9MC_001498 [Kiritimatiellia bacterium]|jgi:hypothetical protein